MEGLARDVISDHVARGGRSDLAADIEACEATSRLARLVERDREILDRLAECGT